MVEAGLFDHVVESIDEGGLPADRRGRVPARDRQGSALSAG